MDFVGLIVVFFQEWDIKKNSELVVFTKNGDSSNAHQFIFTELAAILAPVVQRLQGQDVVGLSWNRGRHLALWSLPRCCDRDLVAVPLQRRKSSSFVLNLL